MIRVFFIFILISSVCQAQIVTKEIRKPGNIDTLFAPVNKTVIYQVSIDGDGSYLKDIAVTNTNNVYSYRLGTGGLSWAGKTGSSLSITKGKGIIIKLTY